MIGDDGNYEYDWERWGPVIRYIDTMKIIKEYKTVPVNGSDCSQYECSICGWREYPYTERWTQLINHFGNQHPEVETLMELSDV